MMTLDGTNTWVLREPGARPLGRGRPGAVDRAATSTRSPRRPATWPWYCSPTTTPTTPRPRASSPSGWGAAYARWTRRTGWAPRGSARATWSSVDGLELHVVATPGHTADSLSFVLPAERAVLTGDTVLGRGTTVVAHPDGELGAYLGSLDRLHALAEAHEIATIWPGHGPVIDDALGALDYYIAHRARAAGAGRGGGRGAAQTAPGGLATDELPRRVVEIVYADVDPVLWGAAELSVRAQLAYLAAPIESGPPAAVDLGLARSSRPRVRRQGLCGDGRPQAASRRTVRRDAFVWPADGPRHGSSTWPAGPFTRADGRVVRRVDCASRSTTRSSASRRSDRVLARRLRRGCDVAGLPLDSAARAAGLGDRRAHSRGRATARPPGSHGVDAYDVRASSTSCPPIEVRRHSAATTPTDRPECRRRDAGDLRRERLVTIERRARDDAAAHGARPRLQRSTDARPRGHGCCSTRALRVHGQPTSSVRAAALPPASRRRAAARHSSASVDASHPSRGASPGCGSSIARRTACRSPTLQHVGRDRRRSRRTALDLAYLALASGASSTTARCSTPARTSRERRPADLAMWLRDHGWTVIVPAQGDLQSAPIAPWAPGPPVKARRGALHRRSSAGHTRSE